MSAIGGIRPLIMSEADRITEQIFALDEPWRGRFIEYISIHVNGGGWPVDQSRVNAWLRDPILRRMVEALLRAWTN